MNFNNRYLLLPMITTLFKSPNECCPGNFSASLYYNSCGSSNAFRSNEDHINNFNFYMFDPFLSTMGKNMNLLSVLKLR